MVKDVIESLFSSMTNPQGASLTLTLIVFTCIIAFYSIFIYYFCLFLSKKNIIELNLSQYTKYDDSSKVKFFAFLFYILEYLILLPIITFLWFGVFSIVSLILSSQINIGTILLISAALVAAIRITSYINKELSSDLAKLLPFTLLAIAVSQPEFFNLSLLLGRFSQIPLLFSNTFYYIIFIGLVELIMRVTDIVTDAFSKDNSERE